MATQTLATADAGPTLTVGSGGTQVAPTSPDSPIVPTAPKDPSPLIPVGLTFPVLLPGDPTTPAAPKPSGCGGGSCPLAQPPAGGTVVITRSAPVDTGFNIQQPTAGGNFLTREVSGLPLWVWLLIAFLALVAISK